ncbi:hypothetical protein [Kribbella sp. NBC_00359]|uniref:hypothetical protein n=1 Tax=Kribbella sp. NBC_00359 TaxID=2975966 RepID=UPI002E21144D
MRYDFEIATRRDESSWHLVAVRTGLFSRGAKATARSIVERWIHEQTGQMRGGRLLIKGRRGQLPRTFEAFVRVRILAGDGTARQLAVAYIGADRMDAYSPPDPKLMLAGQGHD